MAIKSRPVYDGFALSRPAERYLFALAGQGANALLEKLPLSPEILERAEILFVTCDTNYDTALKALKTSNYWLEPNFASLFQRLSTILATAAMSTRLYVAGTEDFIGSIVQIAAGFGIQNASVIKEFRGSFKRRVQCVHCKGFNENVTTSPLQCAHCGLHLFVRDHFSARLNAFQGVCVDAEEPGSIPLPVELYK